MLILFFWKRRSTFGVHSNERLYEPINLANGAIEGQPVQQYAPSLEEGILLHNQALAAATAQIYLREVRQDEEQLRRRSTQPNRKASVTRHVFPTDQVKKNFE